MSRKIMRENPVQCVRSGDRQWFYAVLPLCFRIPLGRTDCDWCIADCFFNEVC